MNVRRCWLRVGFIRSAEDRQVLIQIIDRGADRPRIVVLVRHVDLALCREGVVLALQVQLFDLQLGRFQIQLRAQGVDCGFEKGERRAVERKMSTELAIARVHRSFDRDFSRKVTGVCAEKSHELAKLIDRCGDFAAKVRAEPVG